MTGKISGVLKIVYPVLLTCSRAHGILTYRSRPTCPVTSLAIDYVTLLTLHVCKQTREERQLHCKNAVLATIRSNMFLSLLVLKDNMLIYFITAYKENPCATSSSLTGCNARQNNI